MRTEDGASYRTSQRSGPDPVTEADAIVELIHRTTAFRRKMLAVTLGASLLGGVLGMSFYTSTATEVYGRVAGISFAVGAILSFAVVRRVSDLLARQREARWISELVEQHALEAGPLAEVLTMFRG